MARTVPSEYRATVCRSPAAMPMILGLTGGTKGAGLDFWEVTENQPFSVSRDTVPPQRGQTSAPSVMRTMNSVPPQLQLSRGSGSGLQPQLRHWGVPSGMRMVKAELPQFLQSRASFGVRRERSPAAETALWTTPKVGKRS